jgi:hypothetical protein
VQFLLEIQEIKNHEYYASQIRDMLHNAIVDNYNYYVVNIDSKNILAAKNILAYFASEK